MNTLAINSGGRHGSMGMNGSGEEALFERFLLIALKRKWLILLVFVLVSLGTAIVARRLPNVYSSETLILVDPQQVPSDYVRSTVSGDVRNRLSTLSQQILSSTRLQKVIDMFHLYPVERSRMHPEDVIALMRRNIAVTTVGSGEDLQSFKIAYTSNDPQLAAKVANKLASIFIEENLDAREQMSTGTTEFLDDQLKETRTGLENLEAKIGDFKRMHPGEMPEQQQFDLQMLAQLQARLQMLSDGIYRGEQQRAYLQAVIAAQTQAPAAGSAASSEPPLEAQLEQLLSRYGENYPDVKRLRMQIAEEHQREEAERKAAAERKTVETKSSQARTAQSGAESDPNPPVKHASLEIQSQLSSVESELAKDKKDRDAITASISDYQKKLEAEPIREQEITDLVRDYGISKEHYGQLLDKKLEAEMATQLEIRQKAEKFEVLDPAQVPQRPSRPNRMAIDLAGAAGGLGLGLAMALSTELLGTTIISASQIDPAMGLPVLGVIPNIDTRRDRKLRKWWMLLGAAGCLATMVAACVFFFYGYFERIF
jgi:protein tyrosine kinase modulator